MPQNQRHQHQAQNSVVQNLCKKNIMTNEKIENTEAASKSPPKKGNPGVKPSLKEHPLRFKRR